MKFCRDRQIPGCRCRGSIGLSAGLMLAAAVAAGCAGSNEPPVGTVKGTVTFRNDPVPEGMLYVYSPETGEAGQGEIKDGQFELLSELRTGKYVAFVTPIPPPPPNPENPPANLWGKFPTEIPEKYRRQDQSDLRIDVQEGENDVKIEIPW